jgi:purine nucleosidase
MQDLQSWPVIPPPTPFDKKDKDMTAVIIDCDPGIDDALALLLAAGSPELDLLAVTTVAGNRRAHITSRNARRILDLAGKTAIPVHAGAAMPLGHAQARCNLVHGEDGLGGVDICEPSALHDGPAAVRIVQCLLDQPEHSVTVIAIGPLTNLALAEALSPGILRRAHRLLIMGGALQVPGNITPAAEFNFYADPIAANMVLQAGAEVVLFPLDVTGRAEMSVEWIASFGELDTRCGRAASAMLQAYAQLDPLLHDACPVAYLLDAGLFEGERCAVQVDWRPGATEGHCLARMTRHLSSSETDNATAMMAVRNDALLALVRSRIGALP